MKGSDDFTIFLAGGLLILALLLALTNVSVSGQATQKREFRDYEPIINMSSAHHVGPQDLQDMETFDFTFDSDNIMYQKSYELASGTAENGVLFGEKTLHYSISAVNPVQMVVRFTVVKSNDIAPLVISVNGKTAVARNFNPGQFEIQIDSSYLSNENDITIGSSSSGWQIWAPGLYELANISVEIDGFQNRASNFLFEIGDEIDSFTYGKVDLAFSRNVGLLNARLNTNDIYNARPPSAASFAFRKSDIMKGENVLNIGGSQNSTFAGSGVITIYFMRQQVYNFQTPLNFSKLDYDNFDTAIMSFNAVNVAHPGGLVVTVGNSHGLTFREYAVVNGNSHYELLLDKGNLIEGYNVVSVDSLDGAVFDLTDFAVKLK